MKKLLLLAFGMTILATSGPARAALPPGFSEQSILRPDGALWSEAAGLTFSASGRMFVWERGGRVWIVDEENPAPQPFLDISDEVGAWRDHGLLGFALHPDFEAVGHFYLLYVVDRHHLMSCDSPAAGSPACMPSYDPAANEYFAATIGRLVRYTAVKPAGESDYGDAFEVDPASRRVLIGETSAAGPKDTGFPVLYESHSAGALVFGMDGTLLASFGDGASYSSVDAGSAPETYFAEALADGIIKPKENVGAYRAQLVDSLSGKIVRVDPETGDGVSSNPFYDQAEPRAPRSRVSALGLRNPFRVARSGGAGGVPPGGGPGVLFIGDVGWGAWEELDVARVGGQNFGWPVFEGLEENPPYSSRSTPNEDAPNPLYGSNGCAQEYFYFEELIQEDTLAAVSWPNPCDPGAQMADTAHVFLHSRPAVDWSHSAEIARWPAFDGLGSAIAPSVGAAAPDGSIVLGAPFQGNTSIGGAWYTGTDFPAEYHDTYFHGDFGSRWIRNLVFDADHNLKEIRPFLTDGGWVVVIATDPVKGALYYISWAAYVQKITSQPVGGQNQPPAAVASAVPSYGPSPLTVAFGSAGSSDPDQDPLSYAWDFGDGSQISAGADPVHTYVAASCAPESFTATLTVSDPDGLAAQASVTVVVNDSPPVAHITSPEDGSLYPMDTVSTYALKAQLSDEWTPLNELACAWQVTLHHEDHTHSEPVDTTCETTAAISPLGCGDEAYFYEIALTVTDSSGLSATDKVLLYPSCDNGG